MTSMSSCKRRNTTLTCWLAFGKTPFLQFLSLSLSFFVPVFLLQSYPILLSSLCLFLSLFSSLSVSHFLTLHITFILSHFTVKIFHRRGMLEESQEIIVCMILLNPFMCIKELQQFKDLHPDPLSDREGGEKGKMSTSSKLFKQLQDLVSLKSALEHEQLTLLKMWQWPTTVRDSIGMSRASLPTQWYSLSLLFNLQYPV